MLKKIIALTWIGLTTGYVFSNTLDVIQRHELESVLKQKNTSKSSSLDDRLKEDSVKALVRYKGFRVLVQPITSCLIER